MLVEQNIGSEENVPQTMERLAELASSAQLVRGVNLLNMESVRDGYLERYGFITASGYAYDAIVGIPRDQTTDIPVLATSAWFTSSRGHNEHAMRNLMRTGSPIIFVGPEGSYRPSNLPLPKTGISLAGSAAAALSFARTAADQHHNIIDNNKRLVIGESRGAMIGMGLLAMDNYFGQDIVFADLTAPVFPRSLEVKDIPRLVDYVRRAPISIGKDAAHLALKHLVHYPATLDLHPYALAHQIAMSPAIFSGEAGDLAKLIPKDKIIHITCFKDDSVTMRGEWESLFANHPNVRITPLDGSHLTIGDPETLDYILARNKAFHAEYAQYGAELTGDIVFDGAHQLIHSPT